jgi:diguanylate cyclase (GGDEF)-like protein/PAS domain S-box-containing protein
MHRRHSTSWMDGLRRRARLYDVPEEQAAMFRAQQKQAVLRITPLAMSIQLVCALVVPAALWHQLPHAALLLWSCAIAALAALSFRAWWKSRAAPPRESASARSLRRVVLHALLLGLLWALLPLMGSGLADPEARYLVGVLVSGMVCAGGFALAAVPVAGTLFVALVGTGATVALAMRGGAMAWVFAMQLAGYAAIVVYTVWASARMMAARMVAEARASHQSEVISLLLRDFEDHTTDLLWELDSDYRFVHVSPRLAMALGLSEAQLRNEPALPLLDRLVPTQDEAAAAHWARLKHLLSQRDSFRDQTLITRAATGSRWWSLSARRLTDHDGGLKGWRGVASDITERQKAMQRLNWLAHNDVLTGLVNRTQLRALLEGLLTGDTSSTQPLALVLLDLDGFKHVNDSQGHATGDQLLQMFGQRLLATARRSDAVARLGGDEFAIVVPGVTDPASLAQMLERLLNNLAEPCRVDGQPFSLRASLGVALAPTDGCDADTLMNHADIAMYAAKHAGGHRYCFFNPALAESGRRRVAMTQALRGALSRDEFRLVYQPQVSSQDWRVGGFEALIRWRSPEYGDVSPVDFVPLAEAAGLMPAIGDWVLAQACTHAAGWAGAPQISVNVSATQLDRPDFVARVEELVAGLAPGQVELEITESTLIKDADAAVAILRSLRDCGLRIALDDFGTGYSALGYLRRFPFDTLKIDRSFVTDLTRDGEAQVLVDAILAMARALGMATVAEGVESQAEADLLRAKGCETLQGYLFGRPLEADQVAPFLAGWRRPCASPMG